MADALALTSLVRRAATDGRNNDLYDKGADAVRGVALAQRSAGFWGGVGRSLRLAVAPTKPLELVAGFATGGSSMPTMSAIVASAMVRREDNFGI